MIFDSNFLGSFSAALLTGLIAIWVMRRQLKYDEAKEERIESKNFLKVLTLIKSKGESFHSSGILIVSFYYEDNHMVRGSLKLLKEINAEFNSIDHGNVPQEYYEQFISLITYQNNILKNILAGINKTHGSEGNSEMLDEYKIMIENFILLEDEVSKKIK
ncbi:hypothetical protein [Jeotgalibacillus malaysiensis]|uniref:hypothetical protein n=1 Tax=Jeotgalibacillus malaysiensis TaxID=1508404 RepID=UPI003850E221